MRRSRSREGGASESAILPMRSTSSARDMPSRSWYSGRRNVSSDSITCCYRTDRMRQTVAALFILFAVNAVVADDFKAGDGVTLHYRSVGKGEPVIVLSGGPGFSADYVMPIAEHLSAKYNAIALDQRGTPRSPLETYDTNTLTMAKVID